MNLLNFYAQCPSLPAKDLLNFIAHTLSVGMASAVLFLFSFYAIPVCTSLPFLLDNRYWTLLEAALKAGV